MKISPTALAASALLVGLCLFATPAAAAAAPDAPATSGSDATVDDVAGSATQSVRGRIVKLPANRTYMHVKTGHGPRAKVARIRLTASTRVILNRAPGKSARDLKPGDTVTVKSADGIAREIRAKSPDRRDKPLRRKAGNTAR